MRMRKKKNCGERMEKCSQVWIKNPADYKGKWKEFFGNDNNIYIEIGCGKGRFITETAKVNPDKNYIAIEKVEDVIVMAMEKAVERECDNVLFHSIQIFHDSILTIHNNSFYQLQLVVSLNKLCIHRN